MADPGDLNKLNGDILYAEDISALVNITGKSFKNQAQLIYDSSISESLLSNVRYDQSSTLGTDSSSEIADSPVFGGQVQDDFEDASIDTNIWTIFTQQGSNYSGSVSESGGRLTCSTSGNGNGNSATARATADQAGAIDLNKNITLWINIGSVTSQDEGHQRIYITDGSTRVQLIGVSSETTYRIDIDPGSNNATVGTNIFQESGSSVGIGSLNDGNVWNLEFEAFSGIASDGQSDSHSMQIRYVRYSFEQDTSEWLSDIQAVSETVKNIVLTAETASSTSGASVVFQVSANGGANFENVTLNQVHAFTSTGTQLQFKAIFTTNQATFQLNKYAAFYNLWD